jgi:hypothetical protein
MFLWKGAYESRMNLVREAFNALFPDKPYPYTASITYSGKFKGYNARMQLNRLQKHFSLNLSKNWKGVSRDIQLGLVQHLLARLFKDSRRTMHMDLYAHFLRAVPGTVAKTKTHPLLEERFRHLNGQFFNSLLEQPNLVLGRGVTTLGHYDLGTDTVSISEMLLNHPALLDYVLYHELLHKKHQFSGHGTRRHTYHSTAFREEEHKFPNWQQLEKELSRLVTQKKRASFWGWF